MYHEFRSGTKRAGWCYSYKGSELLIFAKAKLMHYGYAETAARKKVADLMMDKSIAASDRKIEEARQAVESNGSIREQLIVWVHEFERTPEREFLLDLGDVVFFGLVDVANGETFGG